MLKRKHHVQLVTSLLAAALLLICSVGVSNAHAKPAKSSKVKKPVTKIYRSPKKSKGSYSKAKYKKSYSYAPQLEAKDIVVRKTYSTKPEPVLISQDPQGGFVLGRLPDFSSEVQGKLAGVSPRNEVVFYSIDPDLQAFVEALVRKVAMPHVAVVAMQPSTGRILAVADKSTTIPSLSLHAGFPAASLFKLVTTAAALERSSLRPTSLINFRGGNYTLNQWNYRPNAASDRRFMSITEALGKSVNPVFARIALGHLNSSTLRAYAETFGFNSDIQSDIPLPISAANIPFDDYGLSRTAAGFGEVRISPIHAVAVMSAIANQGLMPKPSLVDRIVRANGEMLYQYQPKMLKRLVRADTSWSLLQMMEATTTIGTSRKEFTKSKRQLMPGVDVAAKTGTLKGTNPPGLNNWFIASAPIEQPSISVAVIVVDPKGLSTKASHIGRLVIQKYLGR